MKEFFAILFFGKVVLLTPDPVTIEDRYDLMLDESIVAITSGASLQIDVSSMIDVTTISETRLAVRSRFSNGCLRAILHSDNGKVVLQDKGPAISNDAVRIILSSDSGVPTDTDFSRIEISSCVKLTDVQVHWKNHKK